MISAFIDSSVFIAACLSVRGASHEIVREGVRGNARLVISDDVLDETERNLASIPRRASAALILFREILDAVPFEKINPSKQEVVQAAEYTVLKDAPIVAAARKARVDYLASLDRKHLVNVPEVAKRSGLKIVLPEKLLEEIRQQQMQSGDSNLD